MPDTSTPGLTLDRLRFLRDIAAGHVTRNAAGRDKLRHNTRSSFVDRKIEHEERCGNARLDDATWRLTDAGEQAVAAREARHPVERRTA